MTQGEFIRIRRQELHLTQQALGEMCGYEGRSAGATVQKWEHDLQPVPLNRLRVLAKALQVPLDSPLIP